MFGLGFSELVVILVVALLVFGPKRLPEVARSLGRSMGELRKALDEVKQEVHSISSAPPETPSERRAHAVASKDAEEASQDEEPAGQAAEEMTSPDSDQLKTS